MDLVSKTKPLLPQAVKINEGTWSNTQPYARTHFGAPHNTKVFSKVNNTLNEYIRIRNMQRANTLPRVHNPPTLQ